MKSILVETNLENQNSNENARSKNENFKKKINKSKTILNHFN